MNCIYSRLHILFDSRINLGEVIDFFRHTIQSANNDEEKLDEHLQPIRMILYLTQPLETQKKKRLSWFLFLASELHGAVTRTSPELLRHYENLGNID